MFDLRDELPLADIRIGATQYLRIYGFADIEPRLVEIRIHRHGEDQVLRLTAEQADKIAAGLARAAAKARQ
jgi:hypothetical protein